jgi:acetolactate synthase-1/2/3 large subunit
MVWMGEMKISGGETVVRSLVENDVKTVYGLLGNDILKIFDFLRSENRIKNIMAMHEINAAFMADAHGRLTGEPGVCVVIGGPGATNAVTGIAQAYTEASPVVQITGHSSTNEKIQPYQSVDDLDFLLKIYQPLTKWSTRIEKVEDIPQILNKAFTVAKSGRPGPVHVEIPTDVLECSGKVREFKVDLKVSTPGISSQLEKAAEILNSASNPIIVVGRGVLREFCSDEVIKLAKSLGAVILTLPSALDAIPYECPLYLGYDVGMHAKINSIIDEADAILTIGLDIGERFTYLKKENCALIHVHHDAPSLTLDDSVTSKLNRIINIQAKLKDFVISLEKRIKRKDVGIGTTEERVFNIKKKIQDEIAKCVSWGKSPIHPGEIGAVLRRILDDDAIITLDLGNNSEWMELCYRAKKSNTILKPGRYGSMGFSLPAAIAAKINFPEKQVVAVVGDGGFLMSYMDFPTIVKYNLGIVVIVENNQSYGLIWKLQTAKYKGRTFATELENPKFAELAQSFGAVGLKVKTLKDLKTTLEEAVNLRKPVLVDIDTAYDIPHYFQTRTMRYLWKIKRLKDRILT